MKVWCVFIRDWDGDKLLVSIHSTEEKATEASFNTVAEHRDRLVEEWEVE